MSQGKRVIASHFNKIAHPGEYFAGGWITIRAKRKEHKIVSDSLAKAGDFCNKRALDVGCGIGGYTDILLEKGFKVVGFDIAESMIKVCRSLYTDSNSVELLIADVEHLPFGPNCFHLILAIDMLVYVTEESRRLVLQQLVKLLKPGGLIIVEVKNKACPAFKLKRYRYALGELYSIASVTSVLSNSGCRIEASKGAFWPTFLSPIVVVKARKITEGH